MALGARRMQCRAPPTGLINECTVGGSRFVFSGYCPFRKSNLVLNSLYLFWNNLGFTVELYHWYRGIRKKQTNKPKKAGIFNRLSLYLNYLSTVTLIYFANIQYINVASHNQH